MEDDHRGGRGQSDGLRNRRSRGGEGEKIAEMREGEIGKGEKALDIIGPIAAVGNAGF